MPELIFTMGLPGSGKTTRARDWVAENPAQRVRVGRDPLRLALHGGHVGERWAEDQVTVAQHATVAALLTAGFSVVVDDTNLDLRASAAFSLETVPNLYDVTVAFWDMTDVPLDVCLARNKRRPEAERVPETWIREQHERHIVPYLEVLAGANADVQRTRPEFNSADSDGAKQDLYQLLGVPVDADVFAHLDQVQTRIGGTP